MSQQTLGGARMRPGRRLRRTHDCVWILGVLALGAGCGKGLDGPSPKLEASALPVDPGILCRAQRPTELVLKGKGFSPVPIDIPKDPRIAIPSVTLLRSRELDGSPGDDSQVLFSGDPDDAENLTLLAWDSQEKMRLTINQKVSIGDSEGLVPVGLYDVKVQNPNEKKGQALGALAVVDKPTLTKVTPGLVCVAQEARELVLTGTTLLEIEGVRPTLTVAGIETPFAISKLSDCTRIAHKGVKASYCEGATLNLAKDSIGVGLHDITLKNPETAACVSEEKLALRVVPPPVIEGVNPPVACKLDGSSMLTIVGSGFLEVDGKKPSVSMGGTSIDVAQLTGCEDLETTGLTVKSCTGIELSVDASAFPVGNVSVSVANPEPAGCMGTADAVFRIAGPPTIASVSPTSLCGDNTSDLTIVGTGFDPAAQVRVDNVPATSVMVVSSTEIVASFADGLAVGPHAVTVQNVGSCIATLPAAITVDPSPIVFFVDPPVIYAQIPIEITIFTSGLSAKATQVELVHEDGTTRKLLNSFDSPAKFNKILAQVPAGLKPGTWDVLVTNKGNCAGTLAGGLRITNTLDDALLTGIKPAYVSPTKTTAVTITGSGFAPVPRVYLTPAGASGTARALTAVDVRQGGNGLTAVVPSGLTPGKYDLIVVNPDGKVDVLAAGVTVTSDEPPLITSVTPASLTAMVSNASVTINGAGFEAGAVVELDCLTTSNARTVVPTTEQAPSGDGKSVVVSVTMANATPTAPAEGSVCLVRLTNTDGAFFEFSAFSVTTSSLNLSAWQDGTNLTTPRRALSLVAGRPTSASRYVYAIGGDSGTTNAPTTRGTTVFNTLEAADVDVFGAIGDWKPGRNLLPAPRSGAGAATIGRFVYLLGGHNGSAATATLFRAQILDPLAGPEITDLDATLGTASKGLAKGLYYYRVAALFAGNDLNNPAGESLAGESLPVQLPERAEKIVLGLTWAATPGAHGYRVYRSPTAEAVADSLELVGTVSCGAGANDLCNCGANASQCQFTDEGVVSMASGRPLPSGSLGVWHAVSGSLCTSGDCLLGSAREGLAVTAFESPTAAGKWYLYASGGRNGSGTYLDTYEVATVTVAGDGTQTVADFVGGSDTLSVPRADHGIWVMSRTNSKVISSSGTPNDVWVYIGGGRTTGNATDQTLEAGKLAAAGDLGTFIGTDPLKGNLVGFGTGAANDQLFTFGGVSGAADGTSAALCSGGGACGALPDLKSGAFNDLGNAKTTRMFAGSAQESAFFFVAGGHDGAATLSTTEQTVQ